MSNNFWEDAEEVAMSEEEAEQALQSGNQQEGRSPGYGKEELDEDPEEVFSDAEVLKNARLRLEQGRLYEMLLKHDLFDGVDADPKAVQNVQREIRAFIKERLEILVGLKQDPRIARKVPDKLDLFSDVELQILKQFISKVASKTELQTAPANKPSPVRQTTKNQELKPVVGTPNKNKKLVETEEDIPRLTKPPSKMTIEELRQYNKGIVKRQANKKPAMPKKRVPMPDSQQLTSFYANRVQKDPGSSLVGAILSKMGKSVVTIENVGNGEADNSDNNSRM